MKNLRSLDLQTLDIGQDDSCRAYWYFIPEKLRKSHFKCTHSMDVVKCIRHGMRYETIEYILESTCVSRKDLSDILHISVRQMNRYHADDLLSAEQSGFLYELARLYVRGRDIFGDQITFEKWLIRPQMAIGMEKPLDLLDTSEGFRMVNDLLSQIEYGFYS